MKRCLIIGGGLAGLSAASILSSKNYLVTLLESSPKLGGRTYSYLDSETNTIIDNGQHILMGCYRETLSFLKLISAENNFEYQKDLHLKFINRDKKEFVLDGSKLFYPINLLFAILNYNVLSFSDKISIISFLIKLPFLSRKALFSLTVKDWLTNGNQNKNIITSFWEILCVGALNTNMEKASALVFYEVLLQIFFKGNFASTIILPMFGLSKSFILPAEEFIRNNNGQIILSETVKEIRIINQKITEVKTDKNIFDNYDFVISAVPLLALEKIVPKEILKVDVEFDYSTILNVHIWLDENNFEEKFYGLLDSPLHWIFVKEKNINIVISDADYLADKSKQEILDFVTDELRHYTSIKKDDIVNYKVIKEKRATFIPDIDTLEKRPNNKTTINNLYLAGDWIDTGLPSTIESAVKSGRMAAEMILTANKNY